MIGMGGEIEVDTEVGDYEIADPFVWPLKRQRPDVDRITESGVNVTALASKPSEIEMVFCPLGNGERTDGRSQVRIGSLVIG
jgi:hypothetical protein